MREEIGSDRRAAYRAILCAIALLAMATATLAGPLQDFKKGARGLDKRERAYFDDFRKQFAKAWQARSKVLVAYHHHKGGDIDQVNDSMRALWQRLAKIESERIEAALALAQSDGVAALPHLLKELFLALATAEKLDAAILTERSRAQQYLNDQAPAFRRAGLHRRLAGYGRALLLAKGAQEFLSERGWKDAVKKDGRSSIARRVAILDLLDPAHALVRTQLRASDYRLRIVAAGRLIGAGPEGVDALLDDESEIVRRALLQDVRRLNPNHATWISSVLVRYEKATGGEREEALRTLRALTGQTFGDAPKAWKAWYETRRADVEAGRFKRDEASADAPQSATKTPLFYGIPVSNAGGTIFLCEWGHKVTSPCDNVFQRTKRYVDWFGMDMKKLPDWEHQYPSRRRVFLQQFWGVVGQYPDTSRVGLVLLSDSASNDYPKFRASTNLAPAMLDKKSRRNLERTFKSVVPGWSRWQAPYASLLIAMKLAGLDPAGVKQPAPITADTFVLVSDGAIAGCRYLLPEHIVEDFVRRNRFRRVRLHTVHVGTDGEESRRLLEELAKSTEGTYVRITKTPKAP